MVLCEQGELFETANEWITSGLHWEREGTTDIWKTENEWIASGLIWERECTKELVSLR